MSAAAAPAGVVDPRSRSDVTPRHLRRALGQFATGVTIVSYVVDGAPRGLTVNSFISVSLDPPLVLVSIARTARSAQALSGAPFVVNVLAAGQHRLAVNFAGRPIPDLQVPWVRGRLGYRLRGAMAWFECEPWDQVEAGDHVLVLGRVVTHEQRDVEPLVFQSGQFKEIGQAMIDAARRPPEEVEAITWLRHRLAVEGFADDGVVRGPEPTHPAVTVGRRGSS